MNLAAHLLPPMWLWLGHVVYMLIILQALRKAAWHHLKNTQDTHVFLASCLILWLIWRLDAGVTPGLEFHLLLVTTVTLMFGWPFAVFCSSLAQLGITFEGQATWASYSLNVLCNGVIPIWVTYQIYWLTRRWLPKHFFIYIYICAFAGSALAMLLSRLAGMGILLGSGSYTLADLGDEPLFIFVMLFPEAFTNGLVVTLLVVYYPQWVSSFSDERYLRNK